MQEFKLNSFDGYPIHVRLFDEVKEPIGVVMIAHGMSEHGGKYQPFAEFLNANGYIVFIDDHRAHGLSESDENRGKHSGDIFDKTLRDLIFFYNYLKAKFSLPIYFIGHSYGSFLGQAFLLEYTDVKAVALLGSAYMKYASAALLPLAPVQLLAKDWVPTFVNQAGDKIFSHKYKGDSGKNTWFTRDTELRQKINDDPMCNIGLSINFDWSMFKAFSRIYTKDAYSKLNKETPIGIFSGDMDPIGGHKAKLAVTLSEAYLKAGVKRVDLKLYRGARHDLLNEINKEEVYNDILVFLKSVK